VARLPAVWPSLEDRDWYFIMMIQSCRVGVSLLVRWSLRMPILI
jgi:hypothetical protein